MVSFHVIDCYLLILQTKVPSVKCIISKAGKAKADLLVEAGDHIHFGDLFLEVIMILLLLMLLFGPRDLLLNCWLELPGFSCYLNRNNGAPWIVPVL